MKTHRELFIDELLARMSLHPKAAKKARPILERLSHWGQTRMSSSGMVVKVAKNRTKRIHARDFIITGLISLIPYELGKSSFGLRLDPIGSKTLVMQIFRSHIPPPPINVVTSNIPRGSMHRSSDLILDGHRSIPQAEWNDRCRSIVEDSDASVPDVLTALELIDAQSLVFRSTGSIESQTWNPVVNLRGKHKDVLWKGCHNYDQKSSHRNLLAQLFNVRLPDPTLVALELGYDRDVVKDACNRCIHGGTDVTPELREMFHNPVASKEVSHALLDAQHRLNRTLIDLCIEHGITVMSDEHDGLVTGEEIPQALFDEANERNGFSIVYVEKEFC